MNIITALACLVDIFISIKSNFDLKLTWVSQNKQSYNFISTNRKNPENA